MNVAGGEASRLPPNLTRGGERKGGGGWTSGIPTGMYDYSITGNGDDDSDGGCRESLTDDLLLEMSSASGGDPSPAR